jgi:hypothetical protein
MVASTCCLGTVDGIAAENKNHSNGRLNYDHKHNPKPATRLDHGHKLNDTNLKRNRKGTKGNRISEIKIFLGFLWTLGSEQI